ncbi:MAG: helix-turn-helix transcriptional regulator [Cyanosarcina radialis HA8281-LM2]|jgi:DNA-binding CsgD family transcriptional regulator|nr:helix-turn-helix transcriptional regulator [Cyanosarcina radialis HA8281-LM2]
MMATQDTTCLYDLVGEFHLQDRLYFILMVKDAVKSKQDKPLPAVDLFSSSSLELQEVIRFPVGDRICLIVESESTSQAAKLDIDILLSEREQQIATLVALGQANKQIASQLRISECTVATYLRRMFAKLGVESRAAMVYRCAPSIQQLLDR